MSSESQAPQATAGAGEKSEAPAPDPAADHLDALAGVMLETPAVLIVGLNARGHITLFNQGAEQVSGFRRDAVVGLRWAEPLVRGDTCRVVQAELARRGGIGTLGISEGGLLTAAGEERTIRWHHHPIAAPHNGVALLLIGVDVTEERRARTAQSETERLLRDRPRVFDYTRWGMAVGNPGDAIVRRVNEAYARMFGYTQDELVGCSVEALVAPGERERIPELVRLIREYGRRMFEIRLRRKDHSEFPALVEVTVLFDDDDRARYWLQSVLDISAWKDTERELRQREEVSRQLIESAPDALIVADRAGVIQQVNAEAEAMFGYPRDELQGQSVDVLVPARFRERHAVQREEYFAHPVRRRMGHQGVVWGVRRDGTEFPAEIVLSPFQVGHDAFVTAAVRDVSDRVRMEEELHRRSHELEITNKELEAFSHAVSHDLQAPLRTIIGFSDILLDDAARGLDEDGRELLERVSGAAVQMAELLEALATLSRVSGEELQAEVVNLTVIAREIAIELQEQEPHRAAVFRIESRLLVTGDPRLLRDMLENLLRNAWKFTAEREVARIEVGVEERAGERVFCVRDNGVGFTGEQAAQLFRPFQRLHDRRRYPGTGIGLVTARRIVERHGGRIWAEGEAGRGASFCFAL